MTIKKSFDGLFHKMKSKLTKPESGAIMQFKKEVEKRINEARMQLSFSDLVTPTFLINKGGEIEAHDFIFDEKNKDKEIERMNILCKDPGVETSALIFDSYVNDCSEKEAEHMTGSLKGQENTQSALTVMLYTREKVLLRTLIYTRKGAQKYLWSDKGWEEIPTPQGRLANPFLN